MKHILFFLSFIFLFSSCKKDAPSPDEDKNTTEAPTKNYRITSAPIGLFSNIKQYSIEYITDGNLKSIGTFDFYFSNSKPERVITDGGYHHFYFTSDTVNIVHMREDMFMDDDEPMVNKYNIGLTYNAINQIVEANIETLHYIGHTYQKSDYEKVQYEYNSSGNIVSQTVFTKNNLGEFEKNKILQFTYDTYSNPYYDLPLFPILKSSIAAFKSKNNLLSIEETDLTNNSKTFHQYKYEYFNKLPKNATVTYTSSSGSMTKNFSFEYEEIK